MLDLDTNFRAAKKYLLLKSLGTLKSSGGRLTGVTELVKTKWGLTRSREMSKGGGLSGKYVWLKIKQIQWFISIVRESNH